MSPAWSERDEVNLHKEDLRDRVHLHKEDLSEPTGRKLRIEGVLGDLNGNLMALRKELEDLRERLDTLLTSPETSETTLAPPTEPAPRDSGGLVYAVAELVTTASITRGIVRNIQERL
jgi:predicted nuclease with TOPRIM domain